MKVFAFSASLRTGSFNTTLMNLAAPMLRAHGVEVDLWNFRAANVPIYDPDTSDANYPPSVADAKERIRRADGILMSSPEYNHSLPGAAKNLIDFLSRPPKESPFRGKLVAHLGATPGGFATVHAQLAWLEVFDTLGAWNLPGRFLVSGAAAAFDAGGQLVDPARTAELDKFLGRFAQALTRFVT